MGLDFTKFPDENSRGGLCIHPGQDAPVIDALCVELMGSAAGQGLNPEELVYTFRQGTFAAIAAESGVPLDRLNEGQLQALHSDAGSLLQSLVPLHLLRNGHLPTPNNPDALPGFRKRLEKLLAEVDDAIAKFPA